MMKMNKWTMALAAAGVVSLSSVAQAQEAVAGANAVAASGGLTGYISTSYTFRENGTNDGTFRGDQGDGYSLDVVDLKWSSAQGAGEYATGYTVELWAGPAASDIDTTDNAGNNNTVELMQANIDLRLPVGSGLNLKVGQFGTVVGREVYNYNENAFFTHSYGFAVEPTHHTGILADYQLTDDISVSLGAVGDTTTAQTNAGLNDGSSAYLYKVGYTVPDSLGFLGGTSITVAGVIDAGDGATDNYYLGADIPLPVTGLSYGVSWDVQDNSTTGDSNVVGHYLSYALTAEATLNVRYEHGNVNISGANALNIDGLESLTVGLDYALWGDEIISRIEYRTTDSDNNAVDTDSLSVNLIYQF